jgi:hypothetical protein
VIQTANIAERSSSCPIAIVTWTLPNSTAFDLSPFSYHSDTPETVFGLHTRSIVDKKELEPNGKYRGEYTPSLINALLIFLIAICKLFIHYEKQGFGEATGWLVDKATVVTAGHSMYGTPYGRATDILVCVGYDGDNSTNTGLDQRRGKQIVVHSEYYHKFKKARDLASIRLESAFNDVQPVKWKTCPDKGIDMPIAVVGYPGDIPKGAEGQHMHLSQSKITYDRKNPGFMLEYTLDTAGGESRLIDVLDAY